MKASTESNNDVGDRANDGLRVNGNEVGARVIGEGGNLGCTQQGRIEYAQNGGRIYTDAIDNSGGVNSSDHEVNIKILLRAVMEKAGSKMDLASRNELLASMTDDIADLVLKQNYLQPQAIELSAYQGVQFLGEHARFIRFLEDKGRLDRAVEFLPSEEALKARADSEDLLQSKLTNPELAVVMAYGKMWVYDELLSSDLPDDGYFARELKKYFPDVLGERFFAEMKNHRLHREIISTYLTNGLVNRVGIEAVFSLYENGKSIADITRAYAITRDVFAVQTAWDALSQLDNNVSAAVQLEIETRLRRRLKTAMLWFMNNESVRDVATVADKYKAHLDELLGDDALYSAHFADMVAAKQESLIELGLPITAARIFSDLAPMGSALDIIKLAAAKNTDKKQAAAAYFGVAGALDAARLKTAARELPTNSYWDRRAAMAFNEELSRTLFALSGDVLTKGGFDAWQNAHKRPLDELTAQFNELDEPTLASLSVLLSEMNGLKS